METTVDIGGLNYTITSDGKIYKRRGKGFLKLFPDKDGYLKISITLPSNKTYNEALHRVMWRAFKGKIPDGYTVDHIDDDKSNNHIDNFQLLSAEENAVKGNARHWVITSPEGVRYEVYNATKFCRENNLHQGHLTTIGKWKGWNCHEN